MLILSPLCHRLNVFPLYKTRKKIFIVGLVGTLNLSIKMSDKMQKTKYESNYFRLKKGPKSNEKLKKLSLPYFW